MRGYNLLQTLSMKPHLVVYILKYTLFVILMEYLKILLQVGSDFSSKNNENVSNYQQTHKAHMLFITLSQLLPNWSTKCTELDVMCANFKIVHKMVILHLKCMAVPETRKSQQRLLQRICIPKGPVWRNTLSDGYIPLVPGWQQRYVWGNTQLACSGSSG